MVTKKEIITALSENRGVENIKQIAREILEQQHQQICLEILDMEAPLPYRISWVIDHVVRMDGNAFNSYLAALLSKRNKLSFPGYERNLSYILSQAQIPEAIESEVLELVFFWISDPETKVAVKAHALYTCENFCKKYPELKEEFRETILNELPKNTIAFSYRAKRILKRLNA